MMYELMRQSWWNQESGAGAHRFNVVAKNHLNGAR